MMQLNIVLHMLVSIIDPEKFKLKLEKNPLLKDFFIEQIKFFMSNLVEDHGILRDYDTSDIVEKVLKKEKEIKKSMKNK